MKGFFLGIVKLILGVSLALILLSLTGVATARYFMAKLSVLPPRPVFDNDVVAEQPVPSEVTAEQAQPQPSPAQPETANAAPENPPGSYKAVVVQPIGLVLRSGPGTEHQQLGGVDHNEEVLVLESSEDGQWVKVRISDTGHEGWVKAGNTQNMN